MNGVGAGARCGRRRSPGCERACRRGLADLADALGRGDHARHVVVVREVRRLADGRPDDRRALEDRRAGGESDRGEQERGGRDGAGAVRRSAIMKRRRVTVSPSNAPGMLRSGVNLDCGLLAGVGHGAGRLPIERVGQCAGRQGFDQAPRQRAWPPRGQPPDRARRRAPAAQTASARAGSPSAWACARRDHVGQLGHGVEVTHRGQPVEPERVQAVARQQRQVGVLGTHHAARGVVLEVALADRLDEQRVALAAAGAASPCDSGASPGRATASASRPPSSRSASASRSSALMRSSANAAAAASTVRAMWSVVWASEGNQASNCEGGG